MSSATFACLLVFAAFLFIQPAACNPAVTPCTLTTSTVDASSTCNGCTMTSSHLKSGSSCVASTMTSSTAENSQILEDSTTTGSTFKNSKIERSTVTGQNYDGKNCADSICN